MDNHKNGQQKALVIENGVITDTYTKCILTKGEKEKEFPGSFTSDDA